MAPIYSYKTWAAEVITDANMNRMEKGIRARPYTVDPGGVYGDFDTIQAAIDQCETDTYGSIWLMPGLHTPASQITIQGNNISIFSHRDAIVKKPNSLNDVLIEVGGAGQVDDVVLSGLTINGNKAAQASGMADIEVVNADRFTMLNCRVYSYKGLGLYISDTAGIKHMIQGNIFESGDDVGIYCAGGTNIRILDNLIKTCGTGGITALAIYGSKIADNITSDTQNYGIWVQDSERCDIDDNLIENASLSSDGAYDGIKLITSGGGCKYCGVHGNHIVSTAANRVNYGVNEAGTKNHVVGNTSHGAKTGGFNIGGSGSQSDANTSTT